MVGYYDSTTGGYTSTPNPSWTAAVAANKTYVANLPYSSNPEGWSSNPTPVFTNTGKSVAKTPSKQSGYSVAGIPVTEALANKLQKEGGLYSVTDASGTHFVAGYTKQQQHQPNSPPPYYNKETGAVKAEYISEELQKKMLGADKGDISYGGLNIEGFTPFISPLTHITYFYKTGTPSEKVESKVIGASNVATEIIAGGIVAAAGFSLIPLTIAPAAATTALVTTSYMMEKEYIDLYKRGASPMEYIAPTVRNIASFAVFGKAMEIFGSSTGVSGRFGSVDKPKYEPSLKEIKRPYIENRILDSGSYPNVKETRNIIYLKPEVNPPTNTERVLLFEDAPKTLEIMKQGGIIQEVKMPEIVDIYGGGKKGISPKESKALAVIFRDSGLYPINAEFGKVSGEKVEIGLNVGTKKPIKIENMNLPEASTIEKPILFDKSMTEEQFYDILRIKTFTKGKEGRIIDVLRFKVETQDNKPITFNISAKEAPIKDNLLEGDLIDMFKGSSKMPEVDLVPQLRASEAENKGFKNMADIVNAVGEARVKSGNMWLGVKTKPNEIDSRGAVDFVRQENQRQKLKILPADEEISFEYVYPPTMKSPMPTMKVPIRNQLISVGEKGRFIGFGLGERETVKQVQDNINLQNNKNNLNLDFKNLNIVKSSRRSDQNQNQDRRQNLLNLQGLKQEQEQKQEQKQKQIQRQEQLLRQPPKYKEVPPSRIPRWFLDSESKIMSSQPKRVGGMKVSSGMLGKKNKRYIIPMADWSSVNVTEAGQFMSGKRVKATHPSNTPQNRRMFEKSMLSGGFGMPTIEEERETRKPVKQKKMRLF